MSFFNPFLKKSKPLDEALLEAIKKDNHKKVEELIAKEDINKEDNEFMTPLMHALKYDSFNVCQFLMDNGATLEPSIDSDSIISYLVKCNASTELINYMYNRGASTEAQYGVPPFEMAVQVDSDFETFQNVARIAGIKERDGAKPMIHQVIESEAMDLKTKVQVLTMLIEEYNCNINEESKELPVSTKLFNKRDFDLLAEVIKLGASVNSIAGNLQQFLGAKKVKELAPYIMQYPEVNKPEYFLQILDKNTFKEYIQNQGSVAGQGVIPAIVLNSVINDKEKAEVTELALQKGADINELSSENNPTNALCLFIRNYDIGKNDHYVKFLLEHGAKIEDEGFSALMFAVMHNDAHLVELLLSQGADINYVNYYDNTVLNAVIIPGDEDYSNEQERLDMLKLLVKHNVDIHQPISHYKDATTNDTSFFEAVVDLEYSAIGHYLIDNFDVEINDVIMRMSVKKDLDIDLAKKIIDKNPQVVFTNYLYCKVRDAHFDTGLLPLAINHDKNELAEYILDNYEGIIAHQETNALPMIALRSGYSLDFVKKLISLDPDINRLYYSIYDDDVDGAHSKNIIDILLRGNQDYDEDIRVELGELMIEKGIDLSEPNKRLVVRPTHLDEEGIIIGAINSKKYETKVLSMLIKHGEDPNKPVNNQNESQIQSIVNRYTGMPDDLMVQYLDFFWEASGVDLTYRNNYGTTILLGAAMQCRPKTIKWLAEKGADVHAIGGFDNSPALHKAISNYSSNSKTDRANTVQALIDCGADIEQFDSEQFTPLMSAANYGCFESVICLLKNGANPNVMNEAGETAVHRAILGTETYEDSENPELTRSKILAVLKDGGADLNLGSEQQLPPLSLTIVNQQKEFFNTLMQLEIDINQPDMAGRTPIMLAVAYGDSFFINTLLSQKQIQLDVIDANNESIHFSAVMRMNEEEGVNMLKYFLEQGIPLSEGRDGLNLLHIAAYYVNPSAFEVIKPLFNDINQPDIKGFTPLFWAAYSNVDVDPQKRVYMLKLLIENGADLEHQLEDGANALALAVLAGYKEVADALIEAGINTKAALYYVEKIEGIAPEAIEYLKSNI
ncbi:ankyrin repeat domain-containing protein [Fulvivirga maritima]|uniref:ankyrin repeat domain-containing protein n=1 Tax=Fulvivirga maritima TaxID=2904247 RepID=UPI001F4512C1|nr:ankyrin repeat domain-containing protein [Fulvivirga maritima]UII28786.1 ankyrin repeat domain-containing protein [Fulvivirga maritima]